MYLIFFFIIAIDLYIFQGIKVLTASFDSESSRTTVHWIFWILNISFLLVVAFGFFTFDRAKGMKNYQIMALKAII